MLRRTFTMILALYVILPVDHGAANTPVDSDSESKVVVYYFHRNTRCQSCLKMEELARYDITVEMAPEIESGQLEWQLVNFDEKNNSHFVELFELESPSLVAAHLSNGKINRWEKLDRIWELSDDVDAFDAYVLGTVKEFLDQSSKADNPSGDEANLELIRSRI